MKILTNILLILTLSFESHSAITSDTKPLGGNRIYVNKAAPAGGDGLSWATAFQNINDALLTVTDGGHVWVAAGNYYPDEGGTAINDNQSATFLVDHSISLYGGFDGTETSINQRDLELNKTILSGDIDQNDNSDENGVVEYYTDIVGNNSFHILTLSGTDINDVVDGFIINAGRANASSPNASGAAIVCDGATITLSNNLIQANQMRSRASIWNCIDMHVSHSQFINNYSNDVGAIGVHSSSYDYVDFINNRAGIQASLFYTSGSSISITNSYIQSNQSSNAGALRFQGGQLYLENVVATGNTSGSGAVMSFSSGANAKLVNVTFVGNRASNQGGAINFNSTGTLEIYNSIMHNNQDSSGVNTIDASVISPNVGIVTIQNSNIAGTGGSNNWLSSSLTNNGGNLDEIPYFTQTVLPSTAPSAVGDFRLSSLSQLINAGDNTELLSITDAHNLPRIHNALVDMGALETQYSGDISVSIDSNQLNINAGDLLEYSLVLSNVSSSEDVIARLVTGFNMPVSCNWTAVFSGGSSGAISGDSSVEDNFSLPDNSSVTLSFECDSFGLAGQLVHDATAFLVNGSESITNNNTDNSSTNITPTPTDLSVIHTRVDPSTFAGSQVVYEMLISNHTNNPAPETLFTYDFDDQILCQWFFNYSGGASGPGSGNGDIGVALSLPGNSEAALFALCTVDSNANQTITNIGNIAWLQGTDTDSSNDTETVHTEIFNAADLAASVTGSGEALKTGDTIMFQIDVVNLSNNSLNQVQLTSSQPVELTACVWECISAVDATCLNGSENGFIADSLTMQTMGSASYQISCDVTGENHLGQVTLSATVSNDDGIIDPNLFNNHDTASNDIYIFKSSFE